MRTLATEYYPELHTEIVSDFRLMVKSKEKKNYSMIPSKPWNDTRFKMERCIMLAKAY